MTGATRQLLQYFTRFTGVFPGTPDAQSHQLLPQLPQHRHLGFHPADVFVDQLGDNAVASVHLLRISVLPFDPEHINQTRDYICLHNRRSGQTPLPTSL